MIGKRKIPLLIINVASQRLKKKRVNSHADMTCFREKNQPKDRAKLENLINHPECNEQTVEQYAEHLES